jgi:hypothetical protein
MGEIGPYYGNFALKDASGMAHEPKWTNETTRRVAHAILKLCQPSKDSSEQEPIDWPQVMAFLEAQRDAAIRERDRPRKGRPKR